MKLQIKTWSVLDLKLFIFHSCNNEVMRKNISAELLRTNYTNGTRKKELMEEH